MVSLIGVVGREMSGMMVHTALMIRALDHLVLNIIITYETIHADSNR